jgi:hypothetical protein
MFMSESSSQTGRSIVLSALIIILPNLEKDSTLMPERRMIGFEIWHAARLIDASGNSG